MTPASRVRLIRLPVEEFLSMQQHHDAMLREFSLIALSAEHAFESSVPRRLLALADVMQKRFVGASHEFRDEVLAARRRGDRFVTIVFDLPPASLRWAEDFLALFDQADDFCREGQLLTRPSPPAVAAFRRRLVGEIVAQVRDGAAPAPFAR